MSLDDPFERYREEFPFLCEAWDHLQGYVDYRAYGPDDVEETRSQEWHTTAWRLNKLGQRIRGLMDRQLDRSSPLKLHISRENLRKKILTEEDLPVEAGILHPEASGEEK